MRRPLDVFGCFLGFFLFLACEVTVLGLAVGAWLSDAAGLVYKYWARHTLRLQDLHNCPALKGLTSEDVEPGYWKLFLEPGY